MYNIPFVNILMSFYFCIFKIFVRLPVEPDFHRPLWTTYLNLVLKKSDSILNQRNFHKLYKVQYTLKYSKAHILYVEKSIKI